LLKKRDDRKARDAGSGCDTLLAKPAACGSNRLLPFPHQPLRASCHGSSHSTMPRSATQRAPVFVATHMGTGFAGGLLRAAATRYCAAADCGSSRLQPPPAQDAHANRVGGATPDETTSHSTKLANNANQVAGYSEGNDHSRQPSPQSSPASGRGGDRPFPRLRGKVRKGVGLPCIQPRRHVTAQQTIVGSEAWAAFPHRRLAPTVLCRLSRKAECAAMWDLIRGSLA